MNRGLYALAGASATATAAACANRLLDPMTNVSNVYLGLSRAWVGRGVPITGSGPVIGPVLSEPVLMGPVCCLRSASGSNGPPPSGPVVSVPLPARPGLASGSPACRGTAGRGSSWPSSTGPGAGMPPPGAGAGNAVAAEIAVGSTVTASWMLRPSSRDSACVISARSRVSSCSLTNSLGVAISAVFSTSPSGRVSLSHARWCGSICMVASSSSDLAHTSARSVSLIGRPPLAPPQSAQTQCDQQLCPQVVHAGYHGVHGSRGKD